MTSPAKFKKDKEIIAEYDTQVKVSLTEESWEELPSFLPYTLLSPEILAKNVPLEIQDLKASVNFSAGKDTDLPVLDIKLIFENFKIFKLPRRETRLDMDVAWRQQELDPVGRWPSVLCLVDKVLMDSMISEVFANLSGKALENEDGTGASEAFTAHFPLKGRGAKEIFMVQLSRSRGCWPGPAPATRGGSRDRPEIRAQLVEQLKCLDQQCELRVQLLQDLQDFFRKKAEIEMDYSRNLEKLAERFLAKTRSTKDQQFKKDQNVLSPVNCWNLLLNQVKRESRDHTTLSDIYLNNIIPRFVQVSEDSGRLFKKSKEVGLQLQEDLMKVLNELYTVMKTYHMYNADSISAQSKLKEAEKQEEKQIGKSVKQEDKQTPRSPDSTSSVKFEEKHVRRSSVKKIEKMKEKRQAKYTENRLKAIKARNEYLLALEATNASVFKYYIHDLSDLIDQCCDLGYHASLNRALRTFLSAELNLEQSKHEGLDAIENAVENLDANSDKQRLMEMYNNVFCPPMKFEFQPHMGDMESQLCAQQPVQSELVQRCQQLQSRLSTLKIENEEVKKTMEATLQTIQDIVTIEDFDVSDCFQYSNSMESVKSTVSETFMSKPSIAKRRANQQETEQFYFTKMKEYLEGRNLITKLQAKHDLLQKTLGESLQHEGIFRVSGSQVEVNDIKNAFERGEDPLAGDQNDHDMDSIAGVLKLYFRGLEHPLFPKDIFHDLIACVTMDNLQERALHVRKVLLNLPKTTLIVMRYLFAFLNHLSQFSEENMMDPYNLAICFGPTLMSVPEGHDQVSCQAHVNELIKTIIIQHENIFPGPRELEGPVYSRGGSTEDYW
ncbi:SLIT-ROBO Rho GTPase-activating protein 2 [Willisornis vidua]|uniref:SLIT-ROBO Rho GTPase-activating protein 2 n=1 Tax=Willisornis vidua TaxID=1566151 RepID=A0ABQ9CKD9_9PASS|nr:SLIT-ROBO Rho GTPase-activating protein 2 [Willisornis vidua]